MDAIRIDRPHRPGSRAEARPPLGVLVVGAGFLGAQRAAACRVAKGVRLVALTDADPVAARRVGDRLGAPVVESIGRGLDLPDVSAVIVATPHADHDRSVRLALEAGKHVLCEKPLATDPETAAELAALAERRGLRLATGFNHRFYAPIRDALALVDAGRIGRVERVCATIGHLASPAFLESWHTDPTVSGGGTLMDNGPHACDLVRRFLGPIVAAQGSLRDAMGLPGGVETEAFARFHAERGGAAEVRSSWTQERGYLAIEVRGEAGHLAIDTAPWRLSARLSDGTWIDRRYLADRIWGRVHRRRFGCERSLVQELEAFAAPGPDRPNATGWDGVRAAEMVAAVYRAAARGPLAEQAVERARVAREVAAG